MTHSNQGVEIVDCDTLDQFWEYVSPIGEAFGKSNSRYIFRGQSNSEWNLVPRVLRRDVLDRYKRGISASHKDGPGHFFFEWSLLDSFIRYCDASGLAIPGDSIEFRKYFSQSNITDVHGKDSKLWPEERVVPLMALAQHHGLPTRLLDWSGNPYIGCYFAATSAVSENNSERLALFGIDLNEIFHAKGIRHLRVPGSTSANLSPQAGSFILVDNSGQRGEPFAPDVSLESKLPLHTKILKKVTLPTEFAGDLLLRCDKFGVSAASLFPGYNGATRAVLDSVLAFNFNR